LGNGDGYGKCQHDADDLETLILEVSSKQHATDDERTRESEC